MLANNPAVFIMHNTQQQPQQQLLLRLPHDLASRFAQVVSPRQRSRYLIELLRRELDRESNELVEAAKHLSKLEAKEKALTTESKVWLDTPLVADPDDGFDADQFKRQYEQAQSSAKGKS